MSLYQTLMDFGTRFFKKNVLLKYGFNLSPMYRRSTGRITLISEDLLTITMKLPISYKNRNYVNSIFGGSMFSAADPIPMVQLINLLGPDYVVWDKSAEIFFKRPARETLYAEFQYTLKELQEIKAKVAQQNELEIIKTTNLTNKDKSKVFCHVKKTIYIADKAYFKQKRASKPSQKPLQL
ncbi:PaaI family thioesterase [Flagellimonas sp.]|uniref:PaaI family thioesterase n=1 Tax=Flagellimonas sp. TaxID=2058762 RepID=UPI003B507F8C